MNLIVKIVLILIIVLLGSAILKGLAKGIVKTEQSESYGRAFGIAILWGAFFFLWAEVEPYLFSGIPPAWWLWIRILIYWLFFAVLCAAVYKASFGRAILLAIVYALIVALIWWLFEFILYEQICIGIPILCV